MNTKHRTIKKSVVADIPVIMQLLECGRQKMRANGNLEQWTDGNPKQSLIEADINNGNSYILEEDGKTVATFAFIEGPDITYNNIYEGKWKENTLPYHVIHRMASLHGTHGVFKDILEYCFERCNNIRIDTHRQNSIMRNALSKYGFEYCGIIYLLDGAERLAYQQTRIESNNK
jgi:RimJ/RimL family protein N-acetyltransferase